jgi:alpha-glucosidase
MMKKIGVFLYSVCFCNLVFAQNKVSVASPAKEFIFRFAIVQGHPEYSVAYKGKSLAEHSRLGLTFAGNFFGSDIKMGPVALSDGIDDYKLPQGKTSHVHDEYKEAAIPMQERNGLKRLISLRVRVFNDGVAFRYELPGQKDWHNYTLTDENTQFNLTGNPTATVAFLENFTTSHEHRYNVMPLKEIANDTLMDMPALFEFPAKVYMSITEANLVNYAGMSLMKRNGILPAS